MKITIPRAVIGAAIAVALVAAVGSAAQSEDQPPKDELKARADEPRFKDSDGPRATPIQQAIANRLGELSAPKDEVKTEYGVPPQLDRGIIGWTGSKLSGFTLVVGRGENAQTVRDVVLKGLPESVRETLPASSSKALPVKTAAVSTEDIRQIWVEIAKAEWNTDKSSGYGLDLRGQAPYVQMSVSKLTDEKKSALEKIGRGQLELIEDNDMGRLSRSNDPSPHWGGAEILNRRTLGRCTAGWAARGRTSGTRYSVTAGHCGANGDKFESGPFYGTLEAKRDYPDYDQARLDNSNYAPWLYTDGYDNYSVRYVTAARDGGVGDLICQSGFVSTSRCKIEIISLSYRYCDPDGDCTSYTGRGYRDGDVIGRPGDSGGPMYGRNTEAPRASIRGILIAGTSGGRYIIWERYNSVANHLNVDAVTTD